MVLIIDIFTYELLGVSWCPASATSHHRSLQTLLIVQDMWLLSEFWADNLSFFTAKSTTLVAVRVCLR